MDDRALNVPCEILIVVNEVRIRSAELGDVSVLAALRWQFKLEDSDGSAEPESEAVFVERCADWLRPRILTGPWRAWLAEVAGQPCGHVFLGLVDKVPSPFGGSTMLGYVTNFYVTPEHRNRGLGAALLAEVTRFAEAHSLDTLIVWPSDRSAPLYRRSGFGQPTELLEVPVAPN